MEYKGEYKNDERNGKGKEYEYDNCQINFEGEYRNNKRNGKGKEYKNGQLIFEGDYIYDYRKKGKEYIGRFLIYEGTYIFDRKYEGKGYDGHGNASFELKKGNGEIKEYDIHKGKLIIVFEGEYRNGRRDGKGREYDKNGKLVYEGQYVNGKKTNRIRYKLFKNKKAKK